MIREAWGAYWERATPESWIYREEAEDFVERLVAAIPPPRDARVLDFGSGFGFAARRLAPRVGGIALWDASAEVRAQAAAVVAPHANVHVLAPHEVAAFPGDARFDVILVNSVVQYMTEAELTRWLPVWKALLEPGGWIVVSDLVPPGHHVARDLPALFLLCARHGALGRAVRRSPGFVAATLRAYRGDASPWFRLSREDLRQRAGAAGLAVRFLPQNLTIRQRRYAAVLSDPARPIPRAS